MPQDDPRGLWFQRAYTPSELASIFSHAPESPFPDAVAPTTAREAYLKTIDPKADDTADAEAQKHDVRRAVQEGDECPICYEEIAEGGRGKDALVYDTSPGGCGKSLHLACFKAWSSSAVSSPGRSWKHWTDVVLAALAREKSHLRVVSYALA